MTTTQKMMTRIDPAGAEGLCGSIRIGRSIVRRVQGIVMKILMATHINKAGTSKGKGPRTITIPSCRPSEANPVGVSKSTPLKKISPKTSLPSKPAVIIT